MHRFEDKLIVRKQQKNNLFIGLFVLICLCVHGHVFSETLVLKSGKSVEGKIIEETGKYIKLDYEGVVLTYWKDDIERVDKPKKQEADIKEQLDEKEIKIKIKGVASGDVKEFVDKLESLGQDIQQIILNAQTEVIDSKAETVTEKQRAILQKAAESIKDKMAQIKKLKAPQGCEELQKFAFKSADVAITEFTGEVEKNSIVTELTAYWQDCQKKFSETQKEYTEERQRVLDKINQISK